MTAHSSIAFEDLEADAILLLLDRAFIAASSGSACAAGSMEPSHVLRAMKVPFGYLRGAVRFSFSRDNSENDVDRVLDVLPQMVSDLRTMAAPMEAALRPSPSDESLREFLRRWWDSARSSRFFSEDLRMR